MAEKMTLRDRFAQYDFANCEQGAVIESNWRLVKSEPLSTRHSECATSEDGFTVYIESDRLMAHFAPGYTYEMPDGTSFRCDFKLTPVSTDADGKNTGFKTYVSGPGKDRHGTECYFQNMDITAIKNRLFGKQAWTSQKGPRAGAIPTTRAEAKAYAEQWSAELLGHLNRVQEILDSYTGGRTKLDLSVARQVCTMRAYRHSLTLLAEYKAQEAEQKAERQAKTTAKKADKLGEVSAADMLAILAAKGITLEQLMAAQK